MTTTLHLSDIFCPVLYKQQIPFNLVRRHWQMLATPTLVRAGTPLPDRATAFALFGYFKYRFWFGHYRPHAVCVWHRQFNRVIVIYVGKIHWSKSSKKDFTKYFKYPDVLLGIIEIQEVPSCVWMNCKNRQDCKEWCSFYEVAVEDLRSSSRQLFKHRTKACNIKPGWKDHAEELNAKTQTAF